MMKRSWVWAFPIIGMLMLVTGIVFQVHRQNTNLQMVPVTGSVTAYTTPRGCPIIEFYTQNDEPVTFQASTCGSTRPYDLGESVGVLYNPANPHDAHLNVFLENWFVTLVCAGLGITFIVVALPFILPPLLGKRRHADLTQHGQQIRATITSVILSEALSFNGKHPWTIEAQWLNPATNKLHIFSSRNLWFDPTDFISEPQVNVFIDPGNPKRYSMDMSFLPKLAD